MEFVFDVDFFIEILMYIYLFIVIGKHNISEN